MDRLKEPTIRNDRGWDWKHGAQCEVEGYLAQGELDALGGVAVLTPVSTSVFLKMGRAPKSCKANLTSFLS